MALTFTVEQNQTPRENYPAPLCVTPAQQQRLVSLRASLACVFSVIIATKDLSLQGSRDKSNCTTLIFNKVAPRANTLGFVSQWMDTYAFLSSEYTKHAFYSPFVHAFVFIPVKSRLSPLSLVKAGGLTLGQRNWNYRERENVFFSAKVPRHFFYSYDASLLFITM